MANKRQRKKQAAKKKIELLKQVNVPKKEIKRLKNKPVKEVKKVAAYHNPRNVRARERYHFLESSGLFDLSKEKEKDLIKRMRYWGEEKYQAEINKRKTRKNRKRPQKAGKYLMLYWQDKTEAYAPEGILDDMKRAYRHVSKEFLIQSLRGFLFTPKKIPTEIGTFQIDVTDNPKQSRAFFREEEGDWSLAYEGKLDPRRYKDFLVGVHAVVRLLYDDEEKSDLLQALKTKMPLVNKKTAERFFKDIQWRGF